MRRCITAWAALQLGLLPGIARPGTGESLEELVVTGSRIPASAGASALSIVVLTEHDFSRLGAESIGVLLQQLPLNSGSPLNSGANAAQEDRGGDGSTRVDLRGLGPERTLVLVDGRRVVSGGLGGDASVDLGMIPLTSIERVEVLGAGSSTIYGADAIGGVVNIITRGADATGLLDARLSGSLSSRGDGGSMLAGLTGSGALVHGAISGGIERYAQQAVWMRDRAYSRERETLLDAGTAIPFGLAQTPQGLFRAPVGNNLGLPRGLYTRVAGSGEPADAEDFRAFVDPDDRYNPNADEYLRTPLERTSVWLNGQHQVGDAIRLGWSGLLHRRRSEQVLRPAPVDTRFGIGVPTLANGLPGIPAENMYNAFGTDMRDVRRRLVEAGRRHYEQDVHAERLLATLGGPSSYGWSWEAAVSWSRSDSDQTTSGELRSDHTTLALGPSGLDESGKPVCGYRDPVTGRVPASNVIAGCIPLNLFGGQGSDGLGTIDAAQLAYVTDRFHDRGRNEQWLADAGAHGQLQVLGTDPIGWAAGIEYRRESGYQRPDPDKLAGVSGSVQGNLAAAGEYDVMELYGELRVPLASGRTLFERLDVDAGGRWSHFSTFGSTTNLSGRVHWQPHRSLTLRAGYSDVFRAPPLAALYTSSVRFLGLARDPCGNNPDSQQRSNCAASGVPGGSYQQSPLDQIPVVRGGNDRLEPEQGRSWSAGATWSSRGDALTLSVDYFDTVVTSAIRQLLDQTLLDECANTGAPAICQRISRWPDGTVSEVDARYMNIGSEAARGLDLEARYRKEWRGGTSAMRLLATHLADRSLWLTQGSPPQEIEGTKFERSLYPEWRGLGGLEFARGGWTVGYAAEYLAGVRECTAAAPLLPNILTGCRQIADVLYHDLRLTYTPSKGWSLQLLAGNVTDEGPPRVAFVPAEGNTSTTTYRLLGRTFSLQIDYSVD